MPRDKKTIYGLVQSVREWWKKNTTELIIMGFNISKVDPCLMAKGSGVKSIYVSVYVDDFIIVVAIDLVNETIQGIKERFVIKDQETLQNYLGCEVEVKQDQVSIGKVQIYNKLNNNFGKELQIERHYKTPSSPKYVSIKMREGMKNLIPEKQTLYMSVVGSLIYLVKKSRPDLANPARELLREMTQASEFHLKELKRLVKYTMDTRYRRLLLKPTKS